jgi:hypothetical protein
MLLPQNLPNMWGLWDGAGKDVPAAMADVPAAMADSTPLAISGLVRLGSP